MITKKLSKQQICQVEFLLELNFVIFYIPDKKNRKVNSFLYCPNDCLANNYDD